VTSIAVVCVCGLPLGLAVALAAVLLANCIQTIWMDVLLRADDAVVALQVSSDDALSLRLRGGDWLAGSVLGSTYVVSFLVVLHFRCSQNSKVKRIVIAADAIGADDFRQLRAWLRWRARRDASDAGQCVKPVK